MDKTLARPAFILMLTRHDVTIPEALEMYGALARSPLEYVGFKDVGAGIAQMRELVSRIHGDGRKAVLEVVRPGAIAELAAMHIALELEFDLLIGGNVNRRVAVGLDGSNVAYFPYVGEVTGHPCVLDGSISSISLDAESALALGADGVNLLAFRHRGSDPERLMHEVAASTQGRFLVAGDVDSPARVGTIVSAGAFAFTVGTAVLARRFAGSTTIAAEVAAVLRATQEAMQSK